MRLESPVMATALEALLRSIAEGDEKQVKRALANEPSLAAAAAMNGATRAVFQRYFLARVSHYVYAGDTALHVAAAAYQKRIARELIQNGASPRAVNRRGATPLHYAATGGPGSTHWNPNAQAATIELLIHAGGDPEAADKSGVCPLHVAVRSRCAAAVQTLLAHGANARRRNANGSTPLHLAVQATGRGGSGGAQSKEQQATIIGLLIEHGATLSDTNGRGRTVTQCARSTDVAAFLR